MARGGTRSGSVEASARRPALAGQRVSGHGELLGLTSGGADLPPEVNLREPRSGADQAVVLQPLQYPKDVDRAGREILVQAEDQLIRAVPINRKGLASHGPGADAGGAAVAPSCVVNPDHHLAGGGISEPNV